MGLVGIIGVVGGGEVYTRTTLKRREESGCHAGPHPIRHPVQLLVRQDPTQAFHFLSRSGFSSLSAKILRRLSFENADLGTQRRSAGKEDEERGCLGLRSEN